MRGRWWWWESHRNNENDHLQLAFGCEGGGSGGGQVKRTKKNHLRLAFGCEGGGGGGRQVETPKKTTSGSRLNAREVEVVGGVLEERK